MHFKFVFGSWKINENVYITRAILFDFDITTINLKAISKQRIKTHNYKLIIRLMPLRLIFKLASLVWNFTVQFNILFIILYLLCLLTL